MILAPNLIPDSTSRSYLEANRDQDMTPPLIIRTTCLPWVVWRIVYGHLVALVRYIHLLISLSLLRSAMICERRCGVPIFNGEKRAFIRVRQLLINSGEMQSNPWSTMVLQ